MSGEALKNLVSSAPNFRFSNLCGSSYTGGNIVFSENGNSMFMASGNRVSVVDLQKNKTYTLSFETRSNCAVLALSPSSPSSSPLLLTVDEEGYGQIVSLARGVVLQRINFKDKVKCAEFSPCGAYLAVSCGKDGSRLQIWEAPSLEKSFKMVLTKQKKPHFSAITNLSWSEDSKWVVTAGMDMMVCLTPVDMENEHKIALLNNTQPVMGAWMFDNNSKVVSISRTGRCFLWEKQEEEWTLVKKAEPGLSESGASRGPVTHVSFHHSPSSSSMVLLGHASGTFSLFEVPEFTLLQALSVKEGSAVTAAKLSPQGEWVALGLSASNQVLVWEWRAESFVMKQQGHLGGVRSVAYSPLVKKGKGGEDGRGAHGGMYMATGGLDGKVKVWHPESGFSFATFSDHTASVEALCFSPQGNALLSAGMDGAVRAYDLLRYRNFRTLVSTEGPRVQFGSLAMDGGGDIVAAGSVSAGVYSVHLWALRTGQQLDILKGHESRISSLAFGEGGVLATASWDKTIRVWEIFERAGSSAPESLVHQSSVTSVDFDPVDSTSMAAATLNGHIVFWNVKEGLQTGSIDGLRDIVSGRKKDELVSRGALKGKKSKRDGSGLSPDLNQYFNSLRFSPGGQWIVCASANSPLVCIYDVASKGLLSRVTLSTNNSLTGLKPFLNSKFDPRNEKGVFLSENAKETRELMYRTVDTEEVKRRKFATQQALPGVEGSGDFASPDEKKEWRSNAVGVSSDGRGFVVGSSHGAYVFSMSKGGEGDEYGSVPGFAPAILSENVTVRSVEEALRKKKFSEALVLALALGESKIIQLILKSTPADQIRTSVRAVGRPLLPSLVGVLAANLHPHLERTLEWTLALFELHFHSLQEMLADGETADLRQNFLFLQLGVKDQGGAVARLMQDTVDQMGFIVTARAD